jgi:hypothetical protein
MTTPNRPPRLPGSGLRPIDGRDLEGFEPEGYRESIREPEDDWDEEVEYGLGDRVRRWIGARLTQAAWLVLAAGLALGSAGAAAAMAPAPTGANRPELTWGADKALQARLDAAARDLVLLKDDVDQLGTMTRQTLSSLAQVNSVSLSAAWDGGATALNGIQTRAASLAKSLECSPWDETRDVELSKLYSADLIVLWKAVCAAVATTAPLPNDWNALVTGSRTAIQVATDINSHDSIAAEALQLATAGRYSDALTKLAEAASSIADATAIATALAKVTDVSTLQNWLERTTAMDTALRTLWEEMVASKGRVNAKVTAALKGVAEAKAKLPDDASVLQVVLYELAGRLTVNGISIETARGRLASTIDTLTGGTVEGQ